MSVGPVADSAVAAGPAISQSLTTGYLFSRLIRRLPLPRERNYKDNSTDNTNDGDGGGGDVMVVVIIGALVIIVVMMVMMMVMVVLRIIVVPILRQPHVCVSLRLRLGANGVRRVNGLQQRGRIRDRLEQLRIRPGAHDFGHVLRG